MCLLKIRCLLLIICKCLVITASYAAVKRSVPPNPCPSVFKYEFDNNNKLLGYIASTPPTSFSNVITLDVQYTIGSGVQGSNGSIVLLNTRITEDVHQNKVLLYKLEFPSWQNIPPRITKISMNGNQICFGQPLNLTDVPGITTINLQHVQSLTQQAPSTSPPEVAEVLKALPSSKPFLNICGRYNEVPVYTRESEYVPRSLHPWVAALFEQSDDGLRFTCGSTLISKWHVVTAAHCVKFKLQTSIAEDFWVIIGRENIKKWNQMDGAQIIQAEATYPHPEFKFNTGDSDIAVIRLRDQVNFTSFIKPICLWTSNKNQKLIIKKKGTIISYTAEPSLLTFPVVSEEECLRSNLGFQDITSTRTFCADDAMLRITGQVKARFNS